MQYVIVGLGNHTEEYENTRHNVGMMALDFFLNAHNTSWHFEKKYHADSATLSLHEHECLFLKPRTFMNTSGVATHTVVKGKKALERMIVVYDDIDIPFGDIRISFNRSSGGHNGLKSISTYAKSDAYIRIRIGICPYVGGVVQKPKGEKTVSNFMLHAFSGNEKEQLKQLFTTVGKMIEYIVLHGYENAMNHYNNKKIQK